MDGLGDVTTLAGEAGVSGSSDGSGTSAHFNYPGGVTTDVAGNVFVADTNNNLIRRITPAGSVTTWAGSGARGSADGNGAAAQFRSPRGIVSDGSDGLYVTDTSNYLVRHIDSARNVTTVAGLARVQGSTDGMGIAARFGSPRGIAVDAVGNVYVGDSGNRTLRKIDASGNVTTVAGSTGQSGSADGIGSAARFGGLTGLWLDAAGDILVGSGTSVRKVTPAGVVTTIAGLADLYGVAL